MIDTDTFAVLCVLATVAPALGLLLGHRLGYRAALHHKRRQLEDGKKYREAIDWALRECCPGQKVELSVQARIEPIPERRGTGTLGLHVVPDEEPP